MTRIEDKIEEIETYLEELGSIKPSSIEEYKRAFATKAACERYFEKVVEAIVDLAFLIIKEKKLRIPEEDKQAFDILEKEGIISQNLSKNLQDAKGMRNILAHEYGEVDDEKVFISVTSEIERDSTEFINAIKLRL